MSRFQNTRCSGCYPIFQPNQQAHQDFGGCMEIKYDFNEEEKEDHEEEEKDDDGIHRLLKDPSFIKRLDKVIDYEKTKVMEVLNDLLKEHSDISLLCLLGIIDKFVDPSSKYTDIGERTYMQGLKIWNCFIMNAYIEWQKSGQNESIKTYPFYLLIPHTHLDY